jgi:hypothetical protein
MAEIDERWLSSARTDRRIGNSRGVRTEKSAEEKSARARDSPPELNWVEIVPAKHTSERHE